jgi:hypothetical protein
MFLIKSEERPLLRQAGQLVLCLYFLSTEIAQFLVLLCAQG